RWPGLLGVEIEGRNEITVRRREIEHAAIELVEDDQDQDATALQKIANGSRVRAQIEVHEDERSAPRRREPSQGREHVTPVRFGARRTEFVLGPDDDAARLGRE